MIKHFKANESLRAQDLNDLVKEIYRNRPRRGKGILVRDTPQGQIISSETEEGRNTILKHPFQIKTFSSFEQNRFKHFAKIRHGLVHGARVTLEGVELKYWDFESSIAPAIELSETTYIFVKCTLKRNADTYSFENAEIVTKKDIKSKVTETSVDKCLGCVKFIDDNALKIEQYQFYDLTFIHFPYLPEPHCHHLFSN